MYLGKYVPRRFWLIVGFPTGHGSLEAGGSQGQSAQVEGVTLWDAHGSHMGDAHGIRRLQGCRGGVEHQHSALADDARRSARPGARHHQRRVFIYREGTQRSGR